MKEVITEFLKNNISIHINVPVDNSKELLDFLLSSNRRLFNTKIMKYDGKQSILEFNYELMQDLLKEKCFVLITEDKGEFYQNFDIELAVLNKLPTINYK